MTVRELIELLRQQPQEALVILDLPEGDYNIGGVGQDHTGIVAICNGDSLE